MKAILLAAGLGTRLKPLTNVKPKCLMPIRGKPLLGIWLEKLALIGADSILINTHYLHNQVEDYISSSTYSKKVTLSYEPIMLGTAGTLIANIDFFGDEDGLLIHADNYCLENIENLIKAHQRRPPNCMMTMMTFRTDSPSSCGIVEVDKNHVVTRFYEKASDPPGNLANGAIYVLSQEFLKLLKADFNSATDFSTQILGNFLGKIYTHQTSDLLVDIGTVDAYTKVA